MRPGSAALLGLALLALPARAGDASYDRAVTVLSHRYHARPMWGLSLATFLCRPFTPAGVHRLSMAVFDEVQAPAGEGGLEQAIREAVAPSYSPFIRVLSRTSGECTYVFVRDAGKRVDLLLVNAEPREAVVLGMRLDPEAFQQWLDDPERMGKSRGKDAGRPAIPPPS